MTFAVPFFLLAALAGIIPVLLHMINRQQAPVVPVATLRFLRIAVERTRKRKYLNDVLLLALRVAALVLIAVALSRPMLTHLRRLFGSQSASIVLIVDNSASMGTKDQGGRRWDGALRASEQVLDQLRDGDAAALIVTCGPRRPEGDRLLTNHELLRQALTTLQPSFERADLAARLQEARQLLTQAKTANKEIYVVTDMQAASWEALKSEDEARAANAGEPSILVVDTHGAPLPNAGLREVQVQMTAPVVGVPVEVKVTAVGDALVRQQRHLELFVDGRSRQVSPTLALDAGGTAEHTFTFQLDESGIHRGEVRIVGDDACASDDRLYFALTADPHIPVAIVKARQHEISYLDDAFYLERALAPIAGSGWAIKTTTLAPSALAAEPLSPYAAIYLVNVPALDPPSAQRLANYVRDGGHVVWMCGENVQADVYNGMNAMTGGQLLPATLKQPRERTPDRPDGWRITVIDEQHPALAPLASPATLYQSVFVSKHIGLELGDGSETRVLARLDDGQPILVERRIGAGSSLLWSSSAHVDWSNLPLRPIFLPLVARLTFYMAGSQAAQPQITAGLPLVIPIAADAQPAGVEIVRPAGETMRLTADAQDARTIRYADTHEVGVYRVTGLDPKQMPAYGVAVNLDGAESNPALLEHSELQRRMGHPGLLIVDSPADVTQSIQRLRQGESVMELFLLAVLAALVIEAFVANRRIDRDEQAITRRRALTPQALRRRSREFLAEK